MLGLTIETSASIGANEMVELLRKANESKRECVLLIKGGVFIPTPL